MEGKATVSSATTKETKRLAYWFYGDLVTIHVSGEQTDGRFSLLEWLQPPGEQTPLHGHKRCDQTMYVLEGELPPRNGQHACGGAVVARRRSRSRPPPHVVLGLVGADRDHGAVRLVG
jgi:hypothetical protein